MIVLYLRGIGEFYTSILVYPRDNITLCAKLIRISRYQESLRHYGCAPFDDPEEQVCENVIMYCV